MTQVLCRVVLFDMDGVLVDSTPAVARVWTQWALAHGFDPAEVVYKAHGRPSIATIRELLPNADHLAEDREVERLEIADVEDVVALPGAYQLLQTIPDPYLKGAEVLSITPSECIVIEDAVSGVRSGKAAGSRVLALRTTSPDDELLRAGADWIIDDLSQIVVELPHDQVSELWLLLTAKRSPR